MATLPAGISTTRGAVWRTRSAARPMSCATVSRSRVRITSLQPAFTSALSNGPPPKPGVAPGRATSAKVAPSRARFSISWPVKRAASSPARLACGVLIPAGNVGNAPFFFPPVAWWMTQRARRLHAAVAASAERHGAVYVSLFEERENDPFAQQRALNASDSLQPSDDGYRVRLIQMRVQDESIYGML